MAVPAQTNAEPNVTPMIDVPLVLLIVFMVVVVEGRRTMDINLPETCQTPCGAGDAIVLEVLAGDRIDSTSGPSRTTRCCRCSHLPTPTVPKGF